MQCPRCRIELNAEASLGLSLHACGKCGGIMMDRATFDRAAATQDLWGGLIDRARELEKAAEVEVDLKKVVYLSCPECGGSMARKNFGRVSGAMVDVCIAHGTWFDRGELAASFEFIRDGGAER